MISKKTPHQFILWVFLYDIVFFKIAVLYCKKILCSKIQQRIFFYSITSLAKKIKTIRSTIKKQKLPAIRQLLLIRESSISLFFDMAICSIMKQKMPAIRAIMMIIKLLIAIRFLDYKHNKLNKYGSGNNK